MQTDAPNDNPESGFKLERLSGFSDGVMAIAITLLVLGLEVPSAHEVNETQLTDYLLDSKHPAMGFVVSFVLIGTYWLQHYAIFHYLNRAMRPLIALNGLFLLCLSFLPFPTGLQAVYRHDELAMAFYCLAHLLCGTSLLAMWIYAIKDHRLVEPKLSPLVSRSMTHRCLIAPGLSALALGISFVSIPTSRIILLSIPAFYLSHKTVDAGWQRLRTHNFD